MKLTWVLDDSATLCVIDLETKATAPHAVIGSVGIACVKFDNQDKVDLFDFNLDVTNYQCSRAVSRSTLNFWELQDPSKYDLAFSGQLTPQQFIDNLYNLFESLGSNVYVGSLNTDFDLAILHDLINDNDWDSTPPWDFRKTVCLRGLRNTFPVDFSVINKDKHIAVYDAAAELQEFLRYRNYIRDLLGAEE